MTTTNLTSLEVSKLTAVMTGGGYKRAASKDAAIARYLKTAEEVGMVDAAKLLGDEYGFDTAHHVLVERKKGGYASIPEALADASLIEAPEEAEPLAQVAAELSADLQPETVGSLTEKIAMARNAADWEAAEALNDQRRAAEVDADEAILQPGEETSEGEIGRWAQTDEGPVWTARRPVEDVTPIPDAEIFGDAPKATKVRAVKANPAGTFVGSVTVEDAMNGKLFGGRSKKIAEVAGEPAPAAAKEPKAESKTAMLLRLAQTPEGVTNAKMKELTGWTKLGGFFNAAKKANLDLTRVRENGDTTWRAAPAKAE